MAHQRLDRSALVLLAVTVLIWSSNWIVMKHMAGLIGAFDLVASRYFLGFLVMLAVAWKMGKRLFPMPPLWPTAGGAIAQMAGFQCLSQYALLSGGAGHVAMLGYTMPFWVGLFAWWLLDEPISRRFLAGLGCAALGLLAIVAPWQGLGGLDSSLYALAGGLSWGLGVVITKRQMLRTKPDVLVLTVWQMLFAFLFCLIPAWLVPQPAPRWGMDLFLGLAYMSIMATAIGWWCWMLVVQRLSAGIVAVSSLSVPVLVVLQAWLVLGERPAQLEWLGIAMIMAGLLAVTVPLGRRG